jgi:hypothetical protein
MPPISKEEGEGTEYDMFVIGGGSGGLACAVSSFTHVLPASAIAHRVSPS